MTLENVTEEIDEIMKWSHLLGHADLQNITYDGEHAPMTPLAMPLVPCTLPTS